MQTSTSGVACLEQEEGVVLRAYLDPVGVWTIGAGLTAASGVVKPKAGMVITKVEASNLLQRALRASYEPAVAAVMPNAKQHEFDAGISFHWNLGAIGRASWVKAWRAKKPRAEIRNGLLMWNRAGGRVMPALLHRREREAAMLLDGVYTFESYLLMIQIDVSDSLAALTFLSSCLAEWRLQIQLLNNRHIEPLVIPLQTRAHFLKSCQRLAVSASQLEMRAAEIAASRAENECFEILALSRGLNSHELGTLISHAKRVVFAFSDEMKSRHLLALPPKHVRFYTDDMAFGAAVEDAVPSATYDISEAAKCRAVGRWTASVMHLMRALEVGLSSLASHYGIDADENWNKVLNQIEVKTREVGRKSHGAEAEQWSAEAATHLRFVKNAWRNHAMHPKDKYDEERAVAIFDHSAEFMKHLAEKLSE